MADFVAQMDADFSHSPHIPQMLGVMRRAAGQLTW